jgi:hypothetical protein
VSRLGLLPLILFPFIAFAQNSNQSATSSATSALQVVYVVDGSTVTTYDIDPQTFTPKQVGTLTVGASTFPYIITSPNGHFLYYIAYDDTSAKSEHLWVYTTDATGAPRTPPVQEINNVNGFYLIPQVHPTKNFFYAVSTSPWNSGYITYKIFRYLIDPSTGKISHPQVEATYTLQAGTTYCGLSLFGFNPSGTKLYDEVNCGYPHGGNAVTYNERSLNLQTGALGPDSQVYSWSNFTGGVENVQFVGDLMFDFVNPNNYQQGINSVNIYPLKPNTSKPLLQCTASMLQACGYAGGVAHPSGKYIFMGISQDTTQIDKVELGAKKIVDTSHYIPYRFYGVFSPDGTVAYATYNYSTTFWYVEIYGFDVATSNVTPGGVIYIPSAFDVFFVAQRY